MAGPHPPSFTAALGLALLGVLVFLSALCAACRRYVSEPPSHSVNHASGQSKPLEFCMGHGRVNSYMDLLWLK